MGDGDYNSWRFSSHQRGANVPSITTFRVFLSIFHVKTLKIIKIVNSKNRLFDH